MDGEGQGTIVVPCVVVGGVPFLLPVDANKYPYVNFADGLKTADLNITASKELSVVCCALVGAVETSLVAFPGGILKSAPGLGDLAWEGRIGAVTSSGTWTNVLSTTGPGRLQRVEFGTNYDEAQIQVTLDGDTLFTLNVDGSAYKDISPKDLHSLGGENAWWKEGLYNDTDNYYFLYLKHEIQYKSTILVRVRQQSGVDKNISSMVWYRSIA